MFEYKYDMSRHSYAPQSTMCLLSAAKCNHIVDLLHAGISGEVIHIQTDVSIGAISKIHSEYCPEVPKSSVGCPHKLTSADVTYDVNVQG
jgi:hypothetical protein